MIDATLVHAPLGREVVYPDSYNAGLLFPIARASTRETLSIPQQWVGADIWNAYELSWLNLKGKPIVAMARFVFPHTSPNLVESKSFKLYLNSFNEERFESADVVRQRMAQDLTQLAGQPVLVEMQSIRPALALTCQPLEGICIDDLDIQIDTYETRPDLLRCTSNAYKVGETLSSELLKSNCPVTGQPDWASIQIRYSGPQIDRAGLLAYIVSLRRSNEFHEHCVERIYCDIQQACRPESLLVYARYTRRGGLDINPWRSSHANEVSQVRTPRQ